MKRNLLLLSLILISCSSFSQIVNIESKRIQSDTTGWSGSLGSSFGLTKNVHQVLAIDAIAHTEYKTEKDLWLLLLNYNLLKTDSLQFNNNAFIHLRYNRKLSAWIRWEVFTQWQENVVEGIGTRALAGTGPRFKLSDTKRLHLYAGTAAMYEYEKDVTKPPAIHKDWRSDIYVSASYDPLPILQLITTIYYQPLFTRLADYRILHELVLKIQVTKRLSFNTGWNFLYDAFPASGVPNNVYS